MHLKSISLNGFKSFPTRTTLEFGTGVSVIIGPNGSGKSNVTDAVLWALGEQSPLAVRGQSMQDVIFAGGPGIKARQSAEVELVLDNTDGSLALDFPEVSIVRKLDCTGEGEYRLNGARCRLVDVLEVLSDTGLGKEMHSVISQGRVEAIVTSKPRDRRLLIEEAAGLGKHRKRRRRAQLKLARTQDNLDRALDVEREARSRLRPLKRQSEAAELHARLERQSSETRWELVRDRARTLRAELERSESAAKTARSAHETAERELTKLVERRQVVEGELAAHGTERERLLERSYAIRLGTERIELQREQLRKYADKLVARKAERESATSESQQPAESDDLERLERELAASQVSEIDGKQIATLLLDDSWVFGSRTTAGDLLAIALTRDGQLLSGTAERLSQLAGHLRYRTLVRAEESERLPQDGSAEPAEVIDRSDELVLLTERVLVTLAVAAGEAERQIELLNQQLAGDTEGERITNELRQLAALEAEQQAALRERSEVVTGTEVSAQQQRDRAAEVESELRELAQKLELESESAEEELSQQRREELEARIARLTRRREQLGPVNPLAKREYEEALAHVEELERQRGDLETALRELGKLITDTDRVIRETFEQTFTAAAKNFEEVTEQLFPGGRGRLRLVRDESGPRPVLGGQSVDGEADEAAESSQDDDLEELERERDDEFGVEIELTPSGKSTKRLTLLSGGEKSMTALAFLFAVFIARPCPFYILDEVEAALDDLNIGRFLELLRRYRERAQFIVVTHQKRTMDAADYLYGVSMGTDGVSKVISRKLDEQQAAVA